MDVVMRGTDVTLPADHVGPTIHTLFCGFGPASRGAAAQLIRTGQSASSIRILNSNPDAASSVARFGVATRRWRSGDLACLEANLQASLTRIIIELTEESRLEVVVRLARRLCPRAEILAVVRNRDHAEAVRASGASGIVDEAAIAGALLASAAVGPGTAPRGPYH